MMCDVCLYNGGCEKQQQKQDGDDCDLFVQVPEWFF